MTTDPRLMPVASKLLLDSLISYFNLTPLLITGDGSASDKEVITATKVAGRINELIARTNHNKPLFFVPRPLKFHQVSDNYFNNLLAVPSFDVWTSDNSSTAISMDLKYNKPLSRSYEHSLSLVDSLNSFTENVAAFEHGVKLEQATNHVPIGIYYLHSNSIDLCNIIRNFN